MQTVANNNTNNSQSMSLTYPLLNYVSASMFGKNLKTNLYLTCYIYNFLGTNNSSGGTGSNTSRHYLACSYFVSQHQTIRSFAEDLSIKFGKSLEEIRLWMRYNEVNH
jgi:hypothetical protein